MRAMAPSPLLEAMRAALAGDITCGGVKLPVLPEVAHRILALADDPDAGLEDLSKLIQQDQGVSANILRRANSAAYSTGTPIESIDEALMRLGMSAVSGIALTACMEGEGFKTPGYESERRKMLVHAMLSGGFARELGSLSGQDADVLFVCGLLHTVGKPIVLRLVCDMHRGRKISLEAADVMQLVEEFHARISDIVSKRWNLPEHVRLAALHHQNPDEAPEFKREIRTIALAGELAFWVIWGAREDEDALRKIPLWEVLEFDSDDVGELVERCVALRGITASALL